MVACGPFTVNNEVSYDGLKDLMAVVANDQPHALILAGPFVSQTNSEVTEGCLRYRDLSSGELKYMDYDELTKNIFSFVEREIGKLHTKLVIVPSASEITNVFPVPQPKLDEKLL